LEQLRARGFETADVSGRNALAVSLVGCLADPDPELRDAIAFEALSHFMRHRQLSNETMLTLERELEPKLSLEDKEGFQQPFAALALSEVARADRVEPYMTPSMRAGLLTAGISYFSQVRDYRGFNEREGWRHGVAHGADLLLQLSLNPAFGRREIDSILAALSLQIAPSGHFYIYGEPERLVRPVTAIAGRGLLTEAEWTDWLTRVSAPTPMPNWEAAFSSQFGLAKRHDVGAFINQIYIAARTTSDKNVTMLLAGAEKALSALR
jgi:hypothetical protein